MLAEYSLNRPNRTTLKMPQERTPSAICPNPQTNHPLSPMGERARERGSHVGAPRRYAQSITPVAGTDATTRLTLQDLIRDGFCYTIASTPITSFIPSASSAASSRGSFDRWCGSSKRRTSFSSAPRRCASSVFFIPASFTAM